MNVSTFSNYFQLPCHLYISYVRSLLSCDIYCNVLGYIAISFNFKHLLMKPNNKETKINIIMAKSLHQQTSVCFNSIMRYQNILDYMLVLQNEIVHIAFKPVKLTCLCFCYTDICLLFV